MTKNRLPRLSPGLRAVAATLTLATLATLGAGRLAADDRRLFSSAGQDPYVMILFDTSGSMNWGPGDDAWVPGDGDDPNSKFYQAKAALFEVLSDPGLQNVSWGFSTYNQDDLRVYRKHWLYTPRVDPPFVVDGRLPYPAAGDPKYFGDNCMDDSDSNTSCDLDGDDTLASCGGPVRSDQTEGLGELWSYPVLDNDGTNVTYEWVRNGSRRFELRWRLVSGTLGDDSIEVELRIRERRSNCSSWLGDYEYYTLRFDSLYPQDDDGRPLSRTGFLVWQQDGHSDKSGRPAGFWDPDDHLAANTCAGWEPNDDSSRDDNGILDLKYPTRDDPEDRHATAFDRGDMIPLDWRAEQVWGEPSRDTVRRRLAPSWDPSDPLSIPDFRVGPYFQDDPTSIVNGRLQLRSQYLETPPLVPDGSTPIGASMLDFNEWYQSWEPIAAGETGDPDFGCRNVSLLILTDGDDTCSNSNPCAAATTLYEQEGIKTYVVGFGLSGAAGNSLDCIADNGGTGLADGGPGPILPQNKDELVAALLDILSQIQSTSRTFAAAAVPQAQTDSLDQIFLTSFSPLEDSGIWPGRIDAYRKPIPLTMVGGRLVADRSQVCSGSDDVQCLSWDAGTAMLAQAPTADDVYVGDELKLGDGPDERRVYWSRALVDASVPRNRALFEPPPAGAPQELELYGPTGFGLDPTAPTYHDEGKAVIQRTLVQKQAEIVDPLTGNPVDIDFVLGDVFHSDPILVAGPSETSYFLGAQRGGPTACTTDHPNGGYREFVDEHLYRRQVLLVGSDTGQIHAFDAGLPHKQIVDGELEVSFDSGTGRELFSYIPRTVLPTVARLARGGGHEFGVDGPLRVADVCIDPQHDGTPDEDGREWRTIVVGGLREGGSGYHALDLTQPDELDGDDVPVPDAGYVPSCLEGTGSCGPVPYPSVLWELTDTMDEDHNGSPDLGDSWSTPNIGRIRVLVDGEVAIRYVAVFGGGLDPEFLVDPALETPDGNFLYFVDIETGRVLYKRELDSSAASEPAAVDTDQDGFLDTVYIGTVGGFLYKVDLRDPRPLEGVTIEDWSRDDPASGVPPLAVDVNRVTSSDWEPFAIVDTGGRPIYYPPAVLYVSDVALYALAFGTGDREDLWRIQPVDQHYYMVLDSHFAAGDASLPLTAADLEVISATGGSTSGAPLYDGGWVLVLRPTERLVTKSFAISGLTTFSTYIPDVKIEDGLCARSGVSHLYTVLSTNADGLVADPDHPDDVLRSTAVGDFVSNPYIELGATGQGDDGGTGQTLPCPQELSQRLKEIQPAACRFSPVTLQVKTIRSDTGHICIGEVPICIMEKNWREH